MVDLYPIPITSIPLERPRPQVVPVRTIQHWARETGNPNARRTDMAGITVSSILVYCGDLEIARHLRTREFSYREGSLTIFLRHWIYISRALSRCERRIWTEHELEHLQDNERLMGTLSLRLQSESFMQAFFIQQQRFPAEDHDMIMDLIRETCARIYTQLSRSAAVRRDTPQEYERVSSRTRETCRGMSRRASRGASDRASRTAVE